MINVCHLSSVGRVLHVTLDYAALICYCGAVVISHSTATIQASLKRKWEEVGEEKTEAIKAHVKVHLDMKEQEDLAKTDAKTQARLQEADLKGC